MSRAKAKIQKNVFRLAIIAFITAVIFSFQMQLLAIKPLLHSSKSIKSTFSIAGSSVTYQIIAEQKSFTPPSRGTPSPGQTEDAGGRDDCNKVTLPLVTMVPSDKELGQGERIQSSIGLTFHSHPVFWFYIPELPSHLRKVTFRLQDSDQYEDLYNQDIDLSRTPAIIGFKLPNTAPELKLDTSYKWIVSITCGASESTLSAEAWIERVQPTNFTPSEQPDDQEVQRYADNGFLHETLTYSAIHRSRDQRHTDLWSNLLRELHLSAIATESNIQPVGFNLQE